LLTPPGSAQETLLWPSQANSPDDLFPPGWAVIRRADGDINADGIEDVAMVVKGTDPAYLEPSDPMVGEVGPDSKGNIHFFLDRNPRRFIVALGRNGSGYQVLASNGVLLAPPSFPYGETLNDVAIVEGHINLGQTFMDRRHGERYAKCSYSFALRDGDIVLTAASKSLFRRATDEQEQRDYDFCGGKVSITMYRFSDQKLLSSKTRDLSSEAPVLLTVLTAPWQVENDFYLF
jgi:hypothetical protein